MNFAAKAIPESKDFPPRMDLKLYEELPWSLSGQVFVIRLNWSQSFLATEINREKKAVI